MAEHKIAVPHSHASRDEMEKYKRSRLSRAVEQSKESEPKKKETVESGKTQQMELEELAERYNRKEIDVAKRQRELLGLKPEQFLILKGYFQLPSEEREKEMARIAEQYRKNETIGMEAKRNLVGLDINNWLEFVGEVPLYIDRERMVREYKKKESSIVFGSNKGVRAITSIRNIRKKLNMEPEEFLVKTGMLPKQEKPSVNTIA